MTIIAYILAIPIYWLVEYAVRKAGYPKKKEPTGLFLPEWKTGKEWTLIISPGYWLAHCFKNRIDSFPEHKLHARRRFIVSNNKHNCYVTIALCILALFPDQQNCPSFLVQLIWALAAIRYISRTFEISFAFGGDVFARPRNKSGLSKYSRIKLAFRSYIEIFFLSIPVYYAHCLVVGKSESITLSLFVGTLTNIGYAFKNEYTLLANFVFFQVFATLSLVILSLTIYISRKN
ncbi:MAG: hypothetical protein K2Y09_07495 [Nitrosomonas sp.]|uniref:hypothetical protein n=1 Tax=Nitrosomonas sp. TaxID=42353 RepID=UPI001DEAB5D9|nr:hypothetical protein [Nitrosomonas sp.]MBX9895008.1 hypothetical protein [Nitrosomonas sp.]